MFELPEDQQEFYNSCAKILDVEHVFQPRYHKPTRWNHRSPGNGRFPGRGTIRWFSSDNIYVAFHTPVVTQRFSNPRQCLDYLRQLTNHFG